MKALKFLREILQDVVAARKNLSILWLFFALLAICWNMSISELMFDFLKAAGFSLGVIVFVILLVKTGIYKGK